MSDLTRISIPITVTEREALCADAVRQLRDPRTHARFLIRTALGLTTEDSQSDPMHNRAEVRQDISSAVVA